MDIRYIAAMGVDDVENYWIVIQVTWLLQKWVQWHLSDFLQFVQCSRFKEAILRFSLLRLHSSSTKQAPLLCTTSTAVIYLHRAPAPFEWVAHIKNIACPDCY